VLQARCRASDLVNQVRDRRLVLRFPWNEADVGAHPVEQAGPRPQECWDEVQANLVDQPSIQKLLRYLCPAVDPNILRTGGLAGPL
jgi:hypothetical protein